MATSGADVNRQHDDDSHVTEVSLVITADAGRAHVEALEDLGVNVQSV